MSSVLNLHIAAPQKPCVLSRAFFEQPTCHVAENLIGKVLVWGEYHGVITETEAYVGEDDPACHAACGRTKRNAVMFGPAGVIYVYLIYGMYHCLNIVTEHPGFPAAVLIRGLYMITPHQGLYLNGPGKLCRHLDITRASNGLSLEHQHYTVEDWQYEPKIQNTSRIGISKGKEKPWRWCIA